VIAVGQVLSEKYRLVRLVGDGGMGSVYEAEHLLLGTHVAIKVLHSELARRQGLADRFMQEARVSAQIKSPHVVQVHDVDRTPQGEAFLVMELLQGEPLSARIDRQKKLPEGLACELSIQILEALEAAHDMGVVHRDLKPDNVFLTQGTDRPFVKVIDFGIAKLRAKANEAQKNLTAAGVMMGTAEYMAPEQAFSAGEVDARADIYSVGVMLYEMLAGVRPVGGDDARVIAIKIERGEVTPLVHAAPGVRRELAGLVHRAMAAHPELRFGSAGEMRRALEALLGKKALDASVVPAPPAAPAQKGTAVLPGSRVPSPPAPEQKIGTQMAAPVEAALQVTPPFQGSYAPSPPALARAGTYTPQAPDAYAEEPLHAPPARRSGSRAWLVVLPLVGGAAAVGMYVYYNNYLQEPGPAPAPLVAPVSTLSSATPATPTAPTQPGTQPATPLTTPPLTTPPLSNPSHPQSPSTPSGAPGVPAGPSGAPPLVIPSGFPSAFPFPLPSGSTMPPFQIPSNIPPIFPPYPSAQPPMQPQQPQTPPVTPPPAFPTL
jgi:serine/threonine-protein kinase